ncbi:uncharacterized protein A4U43_C04F18950 [Asparagus officinalis]|uniref:Rhodanese domain-containing protein n=1 Tax=Asparagus officinalis TaxID=4686 RepID=A0A5P1F2J1_ASPOF|nr:uncharacterized protein LOC109837570 [Asparagus officinalis]ONK72392.1 uncharacterized protein A4U43_C04F18950 [Asparagus officinalis]
MLLSVCSAAPSSPSHLQVSFHAGSRAFYHFHKAIEDGRIIEDRPFCIRDGIHAQEISFRTHGTRFMHSLVVERTDNSGSADSSIFSPYPNEFDDIVRGFPNEVIDNLPENLSCSVGEGNGLHSLTGDLKYVENSEIELPSNAGSFGSEFQSYPDSVPRSVDKLIESTSSESSVFTDRVMSTNDQIPMSTTESLNVKESVDNFLSQVTESLDMSIDRAQDAVKSSYDSFVSSYTDAVKSMTESFDNAVSGVFSSADNSRESASSEFAGFSIQIKEIFSKTGTLATDILRRAIIIVEDSLSNAATFVVYSYGSVKSLLPPDFKNAINVSEEKATDILRPFGAAIQQIYVIIEGFEKNIGLDPSDPLVPFLLFLGSSATIGISYWFFTYGGYSGDLAPELTLEMLKNEENAVLIDVRPEDLRERDGLPDLRRSARSKYASVTLPELDGSLRKLLKGGKDIDDALIAVVIRNLKLVKNGSKVIVMDASGGRSKAIARSLKKLGVKNSYLVQGGFKSWVGKGLRVKELKSETALSVLNEEVEAILEDIKPTPTLIIGYGLGIVIAGFAVLEWEKTLQVIGLIGLAQTLYRRFASYEDSEEFKHDVRLLLTPVTVGVQAVSWAAGKLEPNKIGLPTSPSSTSVQDRVLKAAAKHESQPADANDSQGLPTETSSPDNENLDLSEA